MTSDRFLRFWRISALVLAIAAVAFISVAPQVANDFWLQAKVGELIADTHAIPKTVQFTYTPAQNQPFHAHEWLVSLGFHGLIQLVGESGLPIALGFAGLGLFGLMTWLAYRRGEGNLPLAALFGLLAVGVENHRHFLRPELIAIFLLGVYLLLLESGRRDRRFLPFAGAWLVVVVWANSHGSFVLAPILSVLYAIGIWVDGRYSIGNHNENYRGRALVFMAFSVSTLGAIICNPDGLDLLRFVVDFSHSNAPKVMVMEWLPTFDPRFRDNRGFWIGLGCAALTAIAMAVRWRNLSAVNVLVFLMFLTLALQTIRFLVYLGIVAAFVLPTLVPSGWNQKEFRSRWYALLAGVSLIMLGLAAQFGNAFGAFPHNAFEMDTSLSRPMLRELGKEELKGNVINSYVLGAELVYRAYPRLRPSIDSRIDSYGANWTSLNETLFLDDAVLTKFVSAYDVRYMLLKQLDFEHFQKLPSWLEKRWTIRAMDQKAVLLQRADL